MKDKINQIIENKKLSLKAKSVLIEAAIIRNMLDSQSKPNKTKVAKDLDISREGLRKKLQRAESIETTPVLNKKDNQLSFDI